jgi:hypothetical protein
MAEETEETTITIGGEEPLENEATSQEEPPAPAVEDEVVVSIGDEEISPAPTTEKAPEWVRELRRKNREDQRRIRELEERLKATAENNDTSRSNRKPTLEDAEYDTEAYEKALADWIERKRVEEEQLLAAKQAEERAATEWKNKLDSYAKARTDLKVSDFEDAEAEVLNTLGVTQQGIIIQGSENPALLVYALGKNSEQAKKLAAIQDPVKFAFAVAKLEAQLKVTKRNSPPPPETKVSGNGRTAGTVDSTLDRLRAEAEKTGDYTKVTKYKAQLRAKTT